MKTARHILLGVMLAATLGITLYLNRLERSYRDGVDVYSQIEDDLYMGGSVNEPPPGTRAVLNLCDRKDPYAAETHEWTPIPDASPAPDLTWLRKRVEFVDAQLRAGKQTYVHCAAGVSRAGMVVTAYIMFRNGWTRDVALAYVRTKRSIVRPNPAFMERLLDWEQELKAQRSE